MVATTLSPGQVAIIQFNSDDADDPSIPGVQPMQRDSISFVLLTAVGSGTTIYFTDRSWNGTVLGAAGGGDGTYTWTAATDLAAGTVITITEAELTAAGIELIDSGEAIYVFQGTNANTPTTFLHAVEYGDLNDTFGASLLNTGLVAGTSALAIAEDNGSFGERFWNLPPSILFQNINSHLNWHTNENSPQTNHVEGTNLLVAPDIQLWIAGISGGHGLMSVSGDATQNGGLGYNVQTHFQNTSDDGNGLTTTNRFWSPTHILFDTVEGRFFIVDSSGTHDRILQGNISDILNNPGVAPPMTILWSDQPAVSDGDGITGMQIDIANNHIYFTANNQLLRINYNTGNQTATVLADLGLDPDNGSNNWANEIALDLPNGRAFIISTETFSDFQYVPPGFPGAFADPSSPTGWTALVTTMSQNSIHMVQNISPSDTNAIGNTITQLTFNAGYSEDNSIVTGTPQANEFNDSLGRITDIDVNQLTGEIWFTAVQIGVPNATGGLYRATLNVATGALTVVTIHNEGASNRNYSHIHIDEETGFYYATSVEPGQAGQHAVYRGALNAAPGTAPILYATVGNINEMTPRDLTVESAPTVTATSLAAAVTEASNAPNSGVTAGALLFSAVSASDIDTVNGTDEFAGAQVRITGNFQTGATHQDSLRINGNESGTIAASGITYSYNATTGVLTLSGPGTAAEYQAALALVTFHTSGDNVTNYGQATTRTVAASLFDGLLYSDEITNTVSVTGINDAPVNTVGAAATVNEDSSANAITGISVADVDADPATQDIVVTLSVAHGTITVLTNVAGGIVAGDITAGANGTSTITITATQNQINATLAAASGLTYTPTGNFNGADALTVVTNDLGLNGNDPGLTGTGTTEQDSDNKTINITAINDAPTVAGDGTETATTVVEDTPGAGQTIQALFAGQYSDAADNQIPNGGASSPGAFSGIAITANGSSAGTGQWQYFSGGVWTDIGAVSNAAAKLLGDPSTTLIRFNPALNYNGPAPSLTVHLIDNSLGFGIVNGMIVDLSGVGATGGTTAYSTGTVVLSQADITAVNDAPVNTVPGTQTINEDATVTFTGLSIADVDAGSGDLTTTLSIASGALNAGTVLPGLVVTGEGTSTLTLTGTLAEINDALNGLVYTPPADFNGSRTLTIVTNDGGNTGLDPGLTGTATSEQDSDTVTVNITAINDAPTVVGDGTESATTITENSPSGGQTIQALFAGQYSDAADNQIPNGGASSPGAFSGIAVTANGSSAGTGIWQYYNGASWVAIGPASDAAAVLLGDPFSTLIRFQPVPGFTGAAPTLTVHLIDNSLGFGITNGQIVNLSGVGATGGTTAYSTGTVVLSQQVDPGNTAPTLTGVDSPVTFLENTVNATPQLLDASVVFFDAEDNFNGGTIAVSGGLAEDVIAVRNEGTGAGQVGVSGANITYAGVIVGTFAGGTSGTPLTITLNNAANFIVIDRILENLTYANTSDTPTLARALTINVTDAGGLSLVSPPQITVNVTAQAEGTINGTPGDDNPLNGTPGNDFLDVSEGGDDHVFGFESNDIIYYGTAFDANDENDGGPGKDVVMLQGNYTITLDALSVVGVEYLSLQSGSVTRWGDLAGNLYSYNITTVEANVPGGAPGERFTVNAQSLQAGENFTFDGSAETDGGRFMVYGGRGTDTITGGSGNDLFSFEAPRWNPTDTIDGGGGTDAVLLSFGSGLNTIVFGENQLISIESLSVNNRFASDPSQIPSYALVLADGNVAAGAALIVNGQSLLATQTISIDGSAETNGRLRMFGGRGDDVFIGGAMNDEMTGGLGADTFMFTSASQSTVALADQILDFTVGTDHIDLSAIDAIAGGGNDPFSFIGSAAFSNTAGELRAAFDGSVWHVEGDTDGDGAADFLILVTATTADPLTSADFVL